MYAAPVKGLDFTQTLVAADPDSAITLENLIPRKYGNELRKGYSQWVTGLDGEVRSLMSYVSADSTDRLLAGTSGAKVYDVSELGYTRGVAGAHPGRLPGRVVMDQLHHGRHQLPARGVTPVSAISSMTA